MYSQGSNQPTVFTQPEVKRRLNTYAITKDRFQVNGSQATNVGYVNVGNGDYRWFMYGEQEARKRFEDRREMIMLFGELNDHANANTLAVSLLALTVSLLVLKATSLLSKKAVSSGLTAQASTPCLTSTPSLLSWTPTVLF